MQSETFRHRLAMERALENVLERHERIQWLSAPTPWRSAIATLPIWLFALPWTAFALFWEAMVLFSLLGPAGSQPLAQLFLGVFALFGLPFVLVGAAMMSAPFYRYWQEQRTLYAISSHRVLSVRSRQNGAPHVEELAAVDLGEAKIDLHRNGTGTLRLRKPDRRSRHGELMVQWMIARGIDAPKEAMRLIDLMRSSTASQAAQDLPCRA
jgi:hypothetical protein